MEDEKWYLPLFSKAQNVIMTGKKPLDYAKASKQPNARICGINMRQGKSNLYLHFFCILAKNVLNLNKKNRQMAEKKQSKFYLIWKW